MVGAEPAVKVDGVQAVQRPGAGDLGLRDPLVGQILHGVHLEAVPVLGFRLVGEGQAQNDVIAELALHDAGDLPLLQRQGRLLKGGHHLAGGGGVAVGVVLGIVLAVGHHQLVELGLQGAGVRPLELGEEILRLGPLLGSLVIGEGLLAVVHRFEQDVLHPVNLLGVQVLIQLLLVGRVGDGVLHVLVIGGHFKNELGALLGQPPVGAGGVQVGLLHGLAHLLHLGVGGQAAQLGRLLAHQSVIGGQADTLLQQVARRVGHVRQVQAEVGEILLGVHAGLAQQVEKEVGRDIHPVDGEHHVVRVGAGGEHQGGLGQVGHDFGCGAGGGGRVRAGGSGRVRAGRDGGIAAGGVGGGAGEQGQGQGPG